jgi:predicted ABC-type ATPase
MSRPVLTVIAEPNGSGKSTLIEYLMRQGVDFGKYINADDIAREQKLVGDTGSLKAQQLADELRDQCLHSGKSFSFETVMSHESKVQFMQKARATGFTIQLYFVATGDPLVNVGRVRTRVASGGHDVPEDRIVARYHRTIALLPAAMLASDRAVIFDNSIASDVDETMRLRPVIESHFFDDKLRIIPLPPVPLWTIKALNFAALGDAATDLLHVLSPPTRQQH